MPLCFTVLSKSDVPSLHARQLGPSGLARILNSLRLLGMVKGMWYTAHTRKPEQLIHAPL